MSDAATENGWKARSHDRALGLKRGLPPKEMERRLRESAPRQSADLIRMCFYLLELRRTQGFRALGYPSLGHLVKTSLGWGERRLQGMLRCAAVLGRFGIIRDHYLRGRLSWTKVRELGRVLAPGNERHWAQRALKLNSRELEREIYGTEPRHVARSESGFPTNGGGHETQEVSLRLKPEGVQLLDDAVARMSREEGREVPLPEVIQRLAQDYLASPQEGALSPALVLTPCEECGKASIPEENGERRVKLRAARSSRSAGADDPGWPSAVRGVHPRGNLPKKLPSDRRWLRGPGGQEGARQPRRISFARPSTRRTRRTVGWKRSTLRPRHPSGP
jgi:hypothetical protein